MTTSVETRTPRAGLRSTQGAGPVLLATFDVPFDKAATTFAVEAALEAGRLLIVANIVELAPLPMSVQMGSDIVDYTPEMEASLAAPVELAVSMGVSVERIRVKSFRRVEALIEVTRERGVRMLVLGPDRSQVSARLYNKAADAVRSRIDCLVWVTWDLGGPAPDSG